MYLRINKKWQLTLDIIMIIIGTFIMGFAFSVFLEPNNISTGGFSGLSMIIVSLISKVGVEWLSTSIVYLILNLGLFIYAYKSLGKKFALKALIGILSYSGSMELFAIMPINITYETLISAVFGGGLMGIGLGLVVRFGGSTGGGDMVACIVKHKIPQLTIGKIVVSIDIIVVTLSLFAFSDGLILLPYTILALGLALYTTDFIDEGYKQIRSYNILTCKPEDVSNALMSQLGRGCTLTKAKGMHTKEEKNIVTCLVTKFQASQLKSIVKEIDPESFVYSIPVGEVVGEWAKKNELPDTNKTSNKRKEEKEINSVKNTLYAENSIANKTECLNKKDSN